MPLSESDTRAKLIDLAIHLRGWTKGLIRREETAGTIGTGEGRPRRRSEGARRLHPEGESHARDPAGCGCAYRGEGREPVP